MPDLLQYLTEFGFAVLVAVYLLVRMEKKIENLNDSINKLNHQIEKIDNK